MPNPLHALLDWDEQGQPHSQLFGEDYFAHNSGIEHVHSSFLMGNNLPARFATLGAEQRLVIGETGFACGRNFLCCWQLFEQCAGPNAQLHFVSTEQYPFSATDLQRVLQLWPTLTPFAKQLLAQYQTLHPGFQRLVFAGGRVVLTLLVGDAQELLPELDGKIDAWFLDGFNPANNPQLWNRALLQQLARLSAPAASLVASADTPSIRHDLQAAGFQLSPKQPASNTQSLLTGHFNAPPAQTQEPWFARPKQATTTRTALVIGGGLAGCASAASLAARGWQVSILERHAGLAAEASGNPQGVLYLKLSAHGTTLSQLILSGFGYTRRLLEQLQPGRDWQACGVLQLATTASEAKRQQALVEAFPNDLLQSLSQPEAQDLAGIELASGGLFFPEAGWVHPPALCQLLANHANIQVVTHREVLELQKTANGWQALAEGKVVAEASVVVLAGAADIRRFAPAASLPLKRIRGQISNLPATAASQALRTVVCAQGYVAPQWNDQHCLGASFDFNRQDNQPSAEEHQSNLELLQEISSDLYHRLNSESFDPANIDGRVAFRCTTPDYLPLIGPLADPEQFARHYAPLRKDARLRPEGDCPWLKGLYINAAHGSRGLITAPLSGELLAAWIEGEPLPVSRRVANACHPNRFFFRQVIRSS